MPDHYAALRHIMTESPAFMQMLQAARHVAPPAWHVGAGAVRALVWDHLHGVAQWRVPADVDLIYFDASDLSELAEADYCARLRRIAPHLPWEVANQARVHLWYERCFGYAVPPLSSLEEAVATWPEYATCVAVQLQADDTINIVAPHGLDDLFGMIIRHNPARATAAEYQRRIAQKRYLERWPTVTLVAAECTERAT